MTTLLESFCASIEAELGHTPLVEAAQMAATVLFAEDPQLEGIGDTIKGFGKKLGKAAAIGALAFGAANANAAPVQKHSAGHPHLVKHKQTTKVCNATVRNAWNNPKYQELYEQYLQADLARQQKLVDEGKRPYVDEDLALNRAKTQALNAVACAAK